MRREALKKVLKSSAPCLLKEREVAMAVSGDLGDMRLEKDLGARRRYECVFSVYTEECGVTTKGFEAIEWDQVLT